MSTDPRYQLKTNKQLEEELRQWQEEQRAKKEKANERG